MVYGNATATNFAKKYGLVRSNLKIKMPYSREILQFTITQGYKLCLKKNTSWFTVPGNLNLTGFTTRKFYSLR